MKCASCSDKKCTEGKDCTNLKEKIKEKYSSEDLIILDVASQLTEKFYMQKTRMEEILFYAKEMGYQKLGLFFCNGLKEEARIIDVILSKEFKVYSVMCKVCGIERSELLPRLKTQDGKRGISCNPIGQAMILNRRKTELNIAVGLCMGHDILFSKYSKAPVTTLVVKDRVLAHNPLGAIYSWYYRKKRFYLDK